MALSIIDKLRRSLPGTSSHVAPYHPQPKPKPGDRRGKSLAAIAEDTMDVLPTIMKDLPHLDATLSKKYDLNDMQPLDPASCPRYHLIASPTESDGIDDSGTIVSVRNMDSFDAALGIIATNSKSQQNFDTVSQPELPSSPTSRVAVLNLASDKNPGGGWLHGAAAQEEALCFRSSLTLSLHQRYYPWTPQMGLYTRDVVIIRRAMDDGHDLLVPGIQAQDLPVVSVISVAGLRSPPLSADRTEFRDREDREMTKRKMRLILRTAVVNGHRDLVLGAIGCGAFANPVRDVAKCWSEVLKEGEFRGGWWRTVVFAVYDSRGEGNFDVFQEILDGQVV